MLVRAYARAKVVVDLSSKDIARDCVWLPPRPATEQGPVSCMLRFSVLSIVGYPSFHLAIPHPHVFLERSGADPAEEARDVRIRTALLGEVCVLRAHTLRLAASPQQEGEINAAAHHGRIEQRKNQRKCTLLKDTRENQCSSPASAGFFSCVYACGH